MAEIRLIDATDLIARGNASFGGVSDAVLLKKFVDAQPTIDPETIPVARQLREELDRVKKERDAAVEQLRGRCYACKHYTAYHNDGLCATCKHEKARIDLKDAIDRWGMVRITK